MRNLIEELRKLDIEENYDVPVDFKSKVMAKIENDEKVIKLKYVIPMLSTVAVIMVVAIVGTNDIFYSNKTMSMENESLGVKSVGEYAMDGKEESYRADDGVFDLTYSMLKESQDTQTMNDTETTANAVPEYSKSEFYAEIVDILNTNGVTAEVKDLSVKAKCTKQEAEEILFYYEGQIIIDVSGEYVIIK